MRGGLRAVVAVLTCSVVGLTGVTAVGGVGTVGAAERDVGEVVRLRSYDADAGELPEGIAVDKRGRIYVTMTFIGELRVIEPGGEERVVATLPTGNGFGPLGLAVDARGDVYAGVVTLDEDTQGVYRVTARGSSERIAGTEGIGFANGLAFGDRGDLFVTDSITGAVWRIPKHGEPEVWLDHPLLDGNNSAPLPFPIGANGITYFHRTVYVTNTELGTVVAIPVLPDGGAGEPRVHAADPSLAGADGIAADVHGTMYVAVIAQSSIVEIAPDGTVSTLADPSDGLDFTSSVAFGTGRGERTTLFAVNFSTGPFFGAVRTFGPALLAVETGVPGLPQP